MSPETPTPTSAGGNDLVASQRTVLESIASELPLREILERIIALAEAQCPDVVCAVLVGDALGELRYVAAPSLPPALLEARLRGSGEKQPSSTDRNVNSLRDAYRRLVGVLDSTAYPGGLHACWRRLLCKPDGTAIGAFEVFCKETRELHPQECDQLETFMCLVHVTIANDHARRSEHLRSVILENIEDAIFFVQVDEAGEYRFISVNQAFTKLFAVPSRELEGKLLRDVLPPDRQAEIFSLYSRAAKTRTAQRWEEAIKARTGEKHGEITIVPIFDQEDRCTYFVGAVHDLTPRIAAERDRAQLHQKLNQAQRMQALGTLAGGIAHDFNNILAAIGGNTALLIEGIPEDSPLRKSALEIAKASRRAVELVRQILTFSRGTAPSYRVFDPRVVAEEALNLLRSTLPSNIQIVTAFAADAPSIKADATQFHQILINLVTNAAHASVDSNAPIEVKLDAVTADNLPQQAQETLSKRRYLRLGVIDHGAGMDAATAKRAFEPFFTTRSPGEGTGLGLSVVHGIVESHQGFIDLKSSRARGTAVHVYLPAEESSEEPARTSSIPTGHGEHLMYVDDEEGLVELMEIALTKLGYRFVGFTNPVAALDAFAAHPDDIDVVITDIAMPQMSGTQLAKRVREIRSNTPIIMTSGYIKAEDRQMAEELHIDQLVYKSNTIEELASAIATEVNRLNPPKQ